MSSILLNILFIACSMADIECLYHETIEEIIESIEAEKEALQEECECLVPEKRQSSDRWLFKKGKTTYDAYGNILYHEEWEYEQHR